MATKKADQKATRNAGKTGLVGFPKGKLKAAFNDMAKEKAAGDTAAESRAQCALKIVTLAHTFRTSQKDDIPVDTIVEGWRDNMKLVTMELATAGNRFAELKEGKDGAAATAKLTGYGNNVASIAKGLIEFELDPAESYRETRKAVEAARQDHRRTADPDAAALSDAKSDADEAWKELRKAVFDTNHIGLVSALGQMLGDAKRDLMAREEAQPETEETEETESEDIAEAA